MRLSPAAHVGRRTQYANLETRRVRPWGRAGHCAGRGDHPGLAALNAAYASRRELSFHKTGANAYQADIPFFPVLTGAPIPYNVTISNQTYSLDFNFLQRGTLDLSANKLDSVACKIPDGIVEVQLETDDPDFDAILAESSAREGFEIEQGRYYLSEGQSPRLEFQKKDKPQLGKNYFVVTSIILTSALILLQR